MPEILGYADPRRVRTSHESAVVADPRSPYERALRGTPDQGRVLDAIRGGFNTEAEISERTNLSEHTVRCMRGWLVTRGLIRKEGETWQIL